MNRVTVHPIDFLGTQIQVNDDVVYVTKTEAPGFQRACVLELVPYEKRGYIPNPMFNPTKPETWPDRITDLPGLNDRWIYRDETCFKMKLEVEDKRYNPDTRKYEPWKRKVTLDDPKRFIVVK